MGRATGTDARLVQGIPLPPCAEHEKDGIHRFAVIDAGPMAPQGMWFARWEGIHLRWDNWVSVRYAEELNSGKSSVTLQRADRQGILVRQVALKHKQYKYL